MSDTPEFLAVADSKDFWQVSPILGEVEVTVADFGFLGLEPEPDVAALLLVMIGV